MSFHTTNGVLEFKKKPIILLILVYFYGTFYVKWVIFEAQNLEDKIPSLDCFREGKKDIVVFEK